MKQLGLIGLWFFLLTFPILGIKVRLSEQKIDLNPHIPLILSISLLAIFIFYQKLIKPLLDPHHTKQGLFTAKILNSQEWIRKKHLHFKVILAIGLVVLPLLASPYHNTILITALMYVVLGLGLNIVVGLAGLLDLGYVAFYAVGAYTYALLNMHYGLGFWLVLPIAGVLAAIAGILLGIPVLRLRGDYLAIVTLGFGEIIHVVLETWSEFTEGPKGIYSIPKPGLFGIKLGYIQSNIYLYYLIVIMVLITIMVVHRLIYSRIGRAWVALREDELACELMGINTTKVKLTAFGLGATWAGFIGAFFAAKNSFVNPASFTFHQSALILCIVILGGLGSIAGVILAATILILLPEYFRFLEQYRMLFFGLSMVLVMVFKPEGLIKKPSSDYSKLKY